MKMKSIATVATMAFFLVFPSEAFAGPNPGKFQCRMTRTAGDANFKVRQWLCIILASNPTIALATYSTLVTSSSNKGRSESLNYKLEVQDNGDIKAEIKGKTLIAGGTYKFEASGIGIGSYTATSFSTEIKNAEIDGPGDATITASASSPKKGKIKVKLHIKPKNRRHPLFQGYTAEMVGEIKP